MDDIPVGLDVSKNSMQLERYMKLAHGYEIENLGGLSYSPEERKLLLYRIICLGCKQVDMINEYGIGKTTIHDSIKTLVSALQAINPIRDNLLFFTFPMHQVKLHLRHLLLLL